MKPTRFQYFIAGKWFFRLWCAAWALIPAVWVGRELFPLALASSWPTALLFAGGISAAAVLGLVGAAVPGGMLYLPFLIIQGSRNGAPYEPGAVVQILCGAHRDRVAKVYEVWTERRQVRIDLGEAERKAVTDVFDYHQVYRHA